MCHRRRPRDRSPRPVDQAPWREAVLTLTCGTRALVHRVITIKFASNLWSRGTRTQAFWMQTRLFACFYVAGRCLTVRLPAEIVADCRWASLGVWLRWLFVWLF